jgi:hypothetical protein
VLQRTPQFKFISAILFALLVSCLAFSSAKAQDKTPTADQIAETVIFAYGSRPVLTQIRRNGLERGKLTRTSQDGRLEEMSYERRFIRGDEMAKDRVRLDQKMPTSEFSLVYGKGQVWGLISGATFTPREEAKTSFLANVYHDLDALLRYKENKSTLTFVTKDKQKNLELWVLDLVDPEKHRTRYFISSKTYRVLWLEYEEPAATGDQTIKYKKTFHDYRSAQNTLVPFRTVLYENGNQVAETRILTVTFGVKMDEALFQNGEQSNAALQ